MTAGPPTHAAPPPGAGSRPAGERSAPVALALGIVGLLAGFTGVGLLASVVAITMGSLGLQAVSQGRMNRRREGTLRAAIGCGIAALVIWITVIAAVAVTQA